ncbi:MAG: aspartate 1-decarboxylase [Actinobacteria bacterium QS_5_72_10]|nr:MAG: aspartate 1-decarboxylase [Actinobacteria bacterium QS_8_72_14]PSO51701.1 MAG: aspartate 1-decarboxylase [Actinobacteria bacterium QS_5_72_10]
MQRTLMKSKLHRATVTQANLDYMGSVTIDAELMELADIMAHERVQVVDVDNGTRLETYAIACEAGSGQLCVNGAAARLVQRGDRVIVISYGVYDAAEAAAHEPVVVLCDEANRPTVLGPETAYRMAGAGGG